LKLNKLFLVSKLALLENLSCLCLKLRDLDLSFTLNVKLLSCSFCLGLRFSSCFDRLDFSLKVIELFALLLIEG